MNKKMKGLLSKVSYTQDEYTERHATKVELETILTSCLIAASWIVGISTGFLALSTIALVIATIYSKH